VSVLIIARREDDHAQAVKGHLQTIGNDAEILDTSLFPQIARLAMRYSCCSDERRLRLEWQDKTLDFDRYGAVWWRRPLPPTISEQMLRTSHRQFATNEAYEALAGLWQTMDANWINAPSLDLSAQHKAYQLKVAQNVGLRIPATLMTNDPNEARKFIDAHGYRQVVYKSYSSTETEWRETRLLKQDELTLLDQVQHAPVIFQHYVEASYDLRITAVGDRIFPAAIHSQQTDYPVDCRIDIGSAHIEPVEIPTEVHAKLLSLMRRLGLTYGAIDMRLTPQGEYVFFEVNPAGQFMYIEAATRQPIALAIACELDRVDARRRQSSSNEASTGTCTD
jgi:glutathione synthase/RimK-type ligase-like ATP-grasp enzyme